MKVRVKALKRGTRVSPSTGHQVHFDPGANRFPLARRPLIDERDIDHFVDTGFAERPKENARRYGREEEREIINREGRGPGGLDRAAKRVASAAGAEAAGGPATSALDTRQVRNMDPAAGLDQSLKGGAEEDDGEEGDAGLRSDDPDAPPAAGARQPRASRKASGTKDKAGTGKTS